jgi:hypothetical protein
MPVPIERFVPRPDVRERHEITIRAPAALVYEVAHGFDMQSIRAVRGIIWLRGKILGARRGEERVPRGLVAETLAMGWGRLAEEPGRYYVAGAVCRPWEADVAFTPVAADRFERFAEPDLVKIAWTLETDDVAASVTRFATETRAAATDDVALTKFRRYWNVFGIGIVMIRRRLLPALRRESERRWKAGGA